MCYLCIWARLPKPLLLRHVCIACFKCKAGHLAHRQIAAVIALAAPSVQVGATVAILATWKNCQGMCLVRTCRGIWLLYERTEQRRVDTQLSLEGEVGVLARCDHIESGLVLGVLAQSSRHGCLLVCWPLQAVMTGFNLHSLCDRDAVISRGRQRAAALP